MLAGTTHQTKRLNTAPKRSEHSRQCANALAARPSIHHLLQMAWLTIANLALIILFPVAWMAPLARAGLLPFFDLDEMSVLSAISVLWVEDLFLALVVIGLALVAPMLKTLALAAIHFGRIGPRSLTVVEILGKLAMADIFLIATYIVLAKGVGVGRVETAWGLYLFTFCVAASMLITHLTKARLCSQ